MTTALQLSVFDRTLSEMSNVERLAERPWIKMVLSIGLHASFIGSVARAWNPSSFTCTADVWDAAEQIEPVFFALSTSVYVVKRSRPPSRSDHPSWLSEDLSLRLIYGQRLLADMVPDKARKLTPRQKRQHEQQLLDDHSVPPEVRLVLCQARSLPVLLFLAYCVEVRSEFNAGNARELVARATREGLDSLISFAVGICERDGKQPVQPPSGLRSSLPEPMNIRALEERWRTVQAAWST